MRDAIAAGLIFLLWAAASVANVPAAAADPTDTTPPSLTLSGTLTEQGTLGTKSPSYTLQAQAVDGTSKAPQSGVAEILIEVDGNVVDKAAPGCASGNCAISRSWTLESGKYSPGPHTVKVTATDAAGNPATKTLAIELDEAPKAPLSSKAKSTAPSGGGFSMNALLANPQTEINLLPTLDPLNRTESVLSNSGKWSALAWDNSTSGHNTGRDTTTGWGPYDGYSTINGAFWNPLTFSDKTGNAAAITMQTSPGSEKDRYLSIWLDMRNPGSVKSGYQLRWAVNSGGTTYTVKLLKWSAGSETVLASNASVTIAAGTTMAISDTGETVSAWQGSGGSFTSLLSAEDATYTGGYTGIEASGSASRSINFKAGVLPAEAIGATPVLDNLERQEVPLATGKWSKSSWAGEIGGAWLEGYRGYGSNGGLAGAYWNQASFSDAQGGDLVAATVGTGSPWAGEYLSLWLDMPSPGSARSGYEARFSGVNGSSTNYKVELSKWVSGTRTVLSSTSGFSLPVETTMALTEAGGSLVLWSGKTSFTPLLSATDSTYTAGYAGLEVNGGAGTLYNFRAGSISVLAERLAGLPVTEPFDGGTESLANFGSKWSALGWAAGTTPKGSDTTTGWGPANTSPTVNGAYYTQTIEDTGPGIGAVATMAANPSVASRYFSLWLDMPTPSGTKAGYELRFIDTATNTYEVKLSKWASGTQTVLATKASYSFVNGNSLALVDQGGTVSAWTNTGSGFSELLRGADSSFSAGAAGVESSSTSTRLANFKVGTLGNVPPDTTITGGPSGVVVPNVSFSFSATEPGASFECSLDGASFAACASPKAYSGLAEGAHSFRVRAVGPAATDETPAQRSFEVVAAAKASTKVRLLDNLERHEVPLATGKWSKSSWAGEIGGAWMEGGYRGYGGSGGVAGAFWNPTSFSDGGATNLVSATVGSGSPGEGEYLALLLDMPAPGSAHSGYEARFSGVNGSSSNYKVELAKWVSGTRTVLSSTTGFSLPVGTVMALTETAGGSLALWTGTTSSMTTLLSATDSTYTSGYAGLEVKGIAGTEYGFRAGQIDIQPPETTITSGPSGNTPSSEASFSFTSSEEGSSFECSLDGASYGTCASPKQYTSLALGSHTFKVRATDPVGNQDPTAAERTFKVIEPPQTTITSPQPSYTAHEISKVEFSSSKSGSTFKCGLDEGEAPTKSCTSLYTLPEHLGEGWHTFVVAAKDSEGTEDATPAKWTFNTDIYPAAPASSKLLSPEEGRNTSSYYTLKAGWSAGGGVTGVSFQLKLDEWSAFKTIPAKYVLDGAGKQVSWPLAVPDSAERTEAVFFDYYAAAKAEGWPIARPKVKLRAIFDGGQSAAGASEPVTTTFSQRWASSSDASEAIGPATVDLLTGHYTITRSDVSIPVPGTDASLEFSRTFDSSYYSTQPVGTMTLGGAWQPSAPVEAEYPGEAWQRLLIQHQDAVPPEYNPECIQEWEESEHEFPKDECLEEEEIPAADWVEVLSEEGVGIPFERVGEAPNYTYVAPEEAKEYSLSKSGAEFVLTEANGTQTAFAQNGETNEYKPASVSFQGTSKTASMSYDIKEGKQRLKLLIGPAPAGVTCSPLPANEPAALRTKGCRSLTLQYLPGSTWGGSAGEERLTSITYYNASGEESSARKVAEYKYDSSLRLTAEWDPRITPNLKETYTYRGSSEVFPQKITKLTPPGEEPWEFAYYETGHDSRYPLKSVSRASLIESEPTATTTVAYDVPLSGAGAPYDMSAARVAEWGQSDYPVDATAVFPPTEVPGSEPPSDYSKATVHYMDPEGHEVNTASPVPPGVQGDAITTTETDAKGNVVRELSARNRLAALEAPDPVASAHELDSHSEYSSDGTELLQSWGPLHKVRLESGESVEARSHTTINYDEGHSEPLPDPDPRLPTKETVGAIVSGKEGEFDKRVMKTAYDWKLLKPTEQITDPEGLNLHTVTIYDDNTGLVTEMRQPAQPESTTSPHTTKFIYYTTAANAEFSGCGGKPELAGLPCRKMPAAQPGFANPPLLVTVYSTYTNLDQPEVIRETGEGTGHQRTTTNKYDEAGRLKSAKQEITSGDGTALPTVETTYDELTGRPLSQQFLCEKACEGFDSQATTTTYDKLGRPIAYEDADGNKSGVSYDLLGRPVIASDGKGTQEFHYDEESGALIEMHDSAAGTFTASYNADGQMTEQLLPDGLAQKVSYDPTGTAVSLSYEKKTYCSSACTWLSFSREDSIAGQVLKETSTLGNHEYSYDKAGRLTLAKEYGSGGACTTRAYAFDKDSNRLSKTTRAPKESGACDTESSGTKQEYSYDTADRLTGEGVEHDNFGRITNLPAKYSGGGKLTTSYYLNDLTRSQTQDAITNTYNLDASLRQRERIRTGGAEAGTEIYHYAGGSDSPAWTQEGSNWSRDIAALGGGLGAIQRSNGEVTLQLANMHGDVVASAGIKPEETKLLSTERFDEFGNPVEGSPLQGGSAEYGWLGGKGRRTQLPSGVVQMGLRSYVPALGRFLTPDPVQGGSANAYDYVDQDPVNGFDLNGEKFCIHEYGREICGNNGRQIQRNARRARKETRRLSREHNLHTPVVRTRQCTAIACRVGWPHGGNNDAVGRFIEHTASKVVHFLVSSGTHAAMNYANGTGNEQIIGCAKDASEAWRETSELRGAGAGDPELEMGTTITSVVYAAAACAGSALGG